MTPTKHTKFHIAKQGNLVLSTLLLYFLFFGYICFQYPENISYQLIFLQRIFFSRHTWAAIPLLILIFSFMAAREVFFEFAFRNTFYLLLFTFGAGFMWYWIAVRFDLTLIPIFFGIIKVEGFYRFEGYLSLLVLTIISYVGCFLGCAIRIQYEKHMEKLRQIKSEAMDDGSDPWAEFSQELDRMSTLSDSPTKHSIEDPNEAAPLDVAPDAFPEITISTEDN